MRTSTVFSAAAAVLAAGAFAFAFAAQSSNAAPARSSGATGDFKELSVERLTVKEKNGKPRLVLANKAKSPAAIIDGERLGKAGGRPGMLFYNGAGDESGGLITDSSASGGQQNAYGHLSFDQYRQDQTLVLQYGEQKGRRGVGLTVQDRPEGSLAPQVRAWERIQKLPEGRGKKRAIAEYMKRYPQPKRVFVGKSPTDKSSTVMLADGHGVPRLTLRVGTDGDPRIDFLDGKGKVTKSISGE